MMLLPKINYIVKTAWDNDILKNLYMLDMNSHKPILEKQPENLIARAPVTCSCHDVLNNNRKRYLNMRTNLRH